MNDQMAVYAEIARDNSWLSILPEIALGVLALLLLVMEMILPRERRALIPRIALWGQAGVLILGVAYTSIFSGMGEESSFNGLLLHSLRGDAMRFFFLICSMLVCHFGNQYAERRSLPKVELFHLVLIVTAGLMLLVQSNNFILLFVALETVTVGFYILVSYSRGSLYSLEAGLKYLILGAFSSAILLFGIVLLYGVAGNPQLPGSSGEPMNFVLLRSFIEANPDNLLVLAGAVLVLCGVAFKIGAVPFQIWIPDVYQGSPMPTTSFLAVASKAGGFAVLINLVLGPFAPLGDVLVPMLGAIAVLTILFGNLAALSQRNVKRLMGLSGIAHAGYLLIGVVASFEVPWAANAVIFYLFTYLLASFAVFGVMNNMGPMEDAELTLDDFKDLARQNPFNATVLVIGLGSLAGIPPLAGFIGKLLIFIAAFKAGLYGLLGVAVIGVVMSIYYYFGWIMEAYNGPRLVTETGVKKEEEQPDGLLLGAAATSTHRIVLGCLTAGTVLLGFYQGALSYLL